jgi:UTP-glucose-1-phosphate uridylyltransferase
MATKIKKAVFPVAGLGTRFFPATKAMPKEMMPVANKPLIQHAFEEAKQAGIEEFIFVTGSNKSIINDHFDYNAYISEESEFFGIVNGWLPEAGKISFIRQQIPLGLGHAIWCARHVINGDPFAVILADEVLLDNENFLSNMVQNYQSGTNLLAIQEVPESDIGRYGIVNGVYESSLLKINELYEKPKHSVGSNKSIIGRYILTPQIFSFIEKTEMDMKGEIQLTNAIKAALVENECFGIDFMGDRVDCGTYLGLLEANIKLSLRDDKLRDDANVMLKKIVG